MSTLSNARLPRLLDKQLAQEAERAASKLEKVDEKAKADKLKAKKEK